MPLEQADAERAARLFNLTGRRAKSYAVCCIAAVAIRLKAYRDQTAPVLAFYEAKGLVRRVPAIGAIDGIASRVRAAVGR